MKPVGIKHIGLVACGCDSVLGLQQPIIGRNEPGETRSLTNGQSVRYRRANKGVLEKLIDKRYGRRLDRFSKLAICAASQCLEHPSVLDSLQHGDTQRIGISIGNNFGGWSFAELQIQLLYADGMDLVSPYAATAWFPAAAQGEISIRFGIKGDSKTFSAERLSAGVAFEYACLLIEDGTLDWVLAGGVEVPDSFGVLDAMYQQGLVTETVPAGEAACLLLLSKDLSNTIGIILSIGRAGDVDTAMRRALSNAHLAGGDIDCVLLDRPRGVGESRIKRFEAQLKAVRALLGSRARVSLPLPFGETVGAAMAVDVAIACLVSKTGIEPRSECDPDIIMQIDCHGLELSRGGTSPFRIRNVMLNATDEFGQAMSMVVSGGTF